MPTTKNDDPWEGLEPPPTADIINAKRVEAAHQWNFYWARSADRRCLLVLGHDQSASPRTRLPVIRGIEVSLSDPDGSGQRMLTLRLQDTGQRDIFHQLCLDIVESTRSARAEREAVELMLARTWRWHHLLRGGTSGRLSPEEQKGLIGELLVLERILLPELSAFDAVATWRGPLGAPKDFEIGRICVEAKARRGAAEPHILVSSEHQLDSSGLKALFLHVVDLSAATEESKDAFSVTDVASRLHQRIAGSDPAAADQFEALLVASGLDRQQDYSDFLWLKGPDRLFRIGEAFPAITPASFPTGVRSVRYSISLPDCEAWKCGDDDLLEVLRSPAHGG